MRNIAAEGLENDLRQELFLILLELPEETLKELYDLKKIQFYIARTLMNMTSKKKVGRFYKLFNENAKKVSAYKRFLESDNYSGYCQTCVVPAVELLKVKMQGTAEDAHEAIIFNQYVEKRSCESVAVFFDIPRKYVYMVVGKVKKELKTAIQDGIDN